jgi:Ca2+-binding EF-hand superfamily protein
LKKIYQRFQSLDLDKSGKVSIAEFRQVPELANNPLLPRVLALMDENKDNKIEFYEFITALSTFTHAPIEDKLKCNLPSH